ncbi:hypothetical protein Pint_23266 [Pistacia integerrima]|uniref:Uncharacterized protein n=1 Tax=Pistacia integerrima TaxID=434235 RepID=A0ACC0YIY2_9ROSI|nr:hypothetical protein Pint_23266 [Pistacia integerrima]
MIGLMPGCSRISISYCSQAHLLDLMAGKNRLLHDSDAFRGFREGPLPVLNRGPGLMPVHPAALEEELEIQQREMHQMISGNRNIIDDNTHLQMELTAAKDEIHRLGQIIPKLHADKDAEAWELIDRGLKLEAELRTAQSLKVEVVQLRDEVQILNALRQQLTTQVRGLMQDINRSQAENKQRISMRTDIIGIRTELDEARRAFEYEKAVNEELAEHRQIMEKNLISMAPEIETLQAELLNAERRGRRFGKL